ncbi:hypothetical protein PVAP13_6NG115203 [Panicum virgatum]|uniref:Uncharacterized protein n=1 Tax=Panicum virgatum TaxID=38727 RepID=A0A8T0QZI2_PANVG|nr:hypothetical protein PVAP13_6NG115203 [Panicum virgatum]
MPSSSMLCVIRSDWRGAGNGGVGGGGCSIVHHTKKRSELSRNCSCHVSLHFLSCFF